MMEIESYESLEEITEQESGAVQYPNGTIWIGNWHSINGIPRMFVTSMVGLGEKLTATPCAVPNDIKEAMQAHEREQGTEVSGDGYSAWAVNDVIVVVNDNWA